MDICRAIGDGNSVPFSSLISWGRTLGRERVDAVSSPLLHSYHHLRPTQLGPDDSNRQYGRTRFPTSGQRWSCGLDHFLRPSISGSGGCLSWPSTIPADTPTPVYIELDTNPNHDCPTTGGKPHTLSLLLASMEVSDTSPCQVANSLGWDCDAHGRTISLRWEHDGYVKWILGGGDR